mmetsp:Transcript_8084/g.20862  ORF Transcript_8084/g.20862 Transcript_8084/m.20862 type:complete len:200 (+) Transcript_8084:1560-2159(+)
MMRRHDGRGLCHVQSACSPRRANGQTCSVQASTPSPPCEPPSAYRQHAWHPELLRLPPPPPPRLRASEHQVSSETLAWNTAAREGCLCRRTPDFVVGLRVAAATTTTAAIDAHDSQPLPPPPPFSFAPFHVFSPCVPPLLAFVAVPPPAELPQRPVLPLLQHAPHLLPPRVPCAFAPLPPLSFCVQLSPFWSSGRRKCL